MENNKTTIQVTPETRKQIRKIAAEYDCTYGEVVEKLIEKYGEEI